jgi:hypothetical protein
MNMERKYLQKIPAPSRLKPVSTGISSVSSGTSTKPNSGVMRSKNFSYITVLHVLMSQGEKKCAS